MPPVPSLNSSDTAATDGMALVSANSAEFEAQLMAQATVPPPANNDTNNSVSPADGANPIEVPPGDEDELTSLIAQSLKGVPDGMSLVIGTRINALPDELYKALPNDVKEAVMLSASVAVAVILPPDAADRLRENGVGDVISHSTLWLGIVPIGAGPLGPSGIKPGAERVSDPFTHPFTDAAYVMTIKLNGNPLQNAPGVDFRAGWAFLNDIPLLSDTRNALRRAPIVADKADPDTWLFVNAGVTTDWSNPSEIPQTFQDGFDQLSNSIQVTSDVNGNPTGVDLTVEGGGVVTAGALVRVPYTEKVAHKLGDAMKGASAVPVIGPLIAGLGVTIRQSTGLYVGYGTSLSRLTIDSKGEMEFTFPGSSFSANVQDTPAAGANLGADLARGLNPELASNIDRSASPTRTSLSEIINTPTNSVGGQPESNELRLGLYWDELLENDPGLDLMNVGYNLVQQYNANGATASQKENISYLFSRPEMEPVRIMFRTMFGTTDAGLGNNQLYLPTNLGSDGKFTAGDLSTAFADLRERLGATEYSERLGQLGQALYDGGWDLNFGIRDIANAVQAVEDGTGRPIQRNTLLDEIAPLLR